MCMKKNIGVYSLCFARDEKLVLCFYLELQNGA